MLTVDFYTKEDCLLCQQSLTLLEILQTMYHFQLNICNIHERDDWLETYFLMIPVVDIKGTIYYGDQLNFEDLEKMIQEHL